MMPLVAFDADVELREVEVDEASRIGVVSHVLLRDRLDVIATKSVPDSVDDEVLIVFTVGSRKRFRKVSQLVHRRAPLSTLVPAKCRSPHLPTTPL